jgi:predicted TPR repeat methyltransferase
VLRPTARYAHADAYVAGCVERAGLILNAHTDLRLRKERDGSEWIAGALFIASAPEK